MPIPALSLMIVGGDYPNKRGPGRRFELALCHPGEPVELRLEPKNPADPRAVAVFSARGVQLGYLSAERCGRIGALIRAGHEVRSVFQEHIDGKGVIRVSFDGDVPILPPPRSAPAATDDFEADYIPPDD